MNILVGKFGQKLIFNRMSIECKRSNTNGNVSAYLLFKLLFDNNKDDKFFVASDNDLSSFVLPPFDNVVDISNSRYDDIKDLEIDAMLVLTGMSSRDPDTRFINIVNNMSKAKFILLCDDPRCLQDVSNDARIIRVPDVILSQFEGTFGFKGEPIKVKYVPLETASCYGFEGLTNCVKDVDMIIVSNTSGKEGYDRIKVLTNTISSVKGLDIYGRLTDDERMSLNDHNCIGELEYTEMQKVLRRSYSTFIVPIKKNWVTSKYIEALMNGVLPIFHIDYGVKLIKKSSVGLITVDNPRSFEKTLNAIKEGRRYAFEMAKVMYNDIVRPFIDGKILSNMIMEVAKSDSRQ